MADFSQNISNSVRAFGGGPSTKWGDASSFTTMVWGTSTWGEGESLPLKIIKVITNSQPLTWEYIGSDIRHVVSIGSAIASYEMTSEKLTEGSWTYVFPSLATEGEERDFASWTAGTAPDVTFTCQAAGSTSWSEV